MSDWYPDAEASIKLCSKWAAESVTEPLLKACHLYLFGSAIYSEGEQFDALRSDLDIVCLMPDKLSAIERVDLLGTLRSRKAKLELDMIPALHREVCNEPGVSIVALTQFEVAANVHKSGARSFFDKNIFFDLRAGQTQIALDSAGDRAISDIRRQALEYCQKLRNDYLSVCANATGGLAEYRGIDPMPKALMRCAAQIVPNLPDGAWYDTRHGLELLFQVLSQRRDEHPKLSALYKAISIRRGGKGQLQPLSGEQLLLLSELLFDQAVSGSTDEVVLWEVRVAGAEWSLDVAELVFEEIQRIVPDARLRGQREGSIILTIASSLRAFELFQLLFTRGVLKEALDLDVVSVQRIEDGASERPLGLDSHLGQVVGFLERWQPPRAVDGRLTESRLVGALQIALTDRLAIDGGLEGGVLYHPARNDPTATSGFTGLDFMLSWTSPKGHQERIGIEVSLARSRDRLLQDLAMVMSVRFPAILVLFVSDEVAAQSNDALQQLRKVNANVHVVLNRIDVLKQ
jgi:hypothetical protein